MLENFFFEHKQKIIEAPDWMHEAEERRSYFRSRNWDRISEHLEYTLLLYSAGYPMSEIITTTQEMLERFHQHFDINFPEDKLQLWEADSYAYILWLLGLAVLSNHQESLERIPNWLSPDIDKNGDWIKDGAPLVDTPLKALLDLIGYSGKLQINPEPFFPKGVYPIIPEMLQPAADKGKLMRQYLKGWYKTNKDTYWYNNHKGGLFFGYCSFEAGMLAALLGIRLDESKFKEMSFYPKNYVDYARANGFATLK